LAGKKNILSEEARLQRQLAHEGVFTKIYARSCEVRRIDKTAFAEFMDLYHTLGNASCRYRYGLFTLKDGAFPSGTMVAAAGFSSAWKMSALRSDGTIMPGADGMALEDEYGNPLHIRSFEWIRYASLPGVRVLGGMGKVLGKFIEEAGPDDIMSYSPVGTWPAAGGYPEVDFGDTYRKLGFRLEGIKSPGGEECRKYRLMLATASSVLKHDKKENGS